MTYDNAEAYNAALKDAEDLILKEVIKPMAKDTGCRFGKAYESLARGCFARLKKNTIEVKK